MRILVTGAFGFLGGRISNFLASKGHTVVLGASKERKMPKWIDKNAEVTRINWADDSVLKRECGRADIVIHAAGMNAKQCAENPSKALDFNGFTTERLVKSCEEEGVLGVIYLSTVHVYSSNLNGMFSEDSQPQNDHPYATTNLVGENALLSKKDEKSLNRLVLRLSNAVGSPMSKDSNCWMLLINDICKQIITKGKIVIRSPAHLMRDFFPVSLLCNTVSTFAKMKNFETNLLNVSSSKATSIERIVDIVCNRSRIVLGYNPKVIYKNNSKSDTDNLLMISNERLKSLINVETNLNNEIDSLLLNCKNWFG